MLFITEIKLTVLELGGTARVNLRIDYKCDFKLAWAVELLSSVISVFLILW